MLTLLFSDLILGGCNGYSYTMNYAHIDDINSKKDEIVTTNNVTVLVDPKATFYIAGTVMDYEVCILFFRTVFHSSLSNFFAG